MFLEYVSFIIQVFQPANLFYFKICEGQWKRSRTTSYEFVIHKRFREPIKSLYHDCCLCSDTIKYRWCKSWYTWLPHTVLHKFYQESGSTENEELRDPSLRKRKLTDTLFPAACIFCGKEKRYNDWKPKFPSFKHLDARWQSTEPRVTEIGDTQLYRLVQGQDLFAREAQCHAF